MIKPILITVLCLSAGLPVFADKSHMTARELAETRLMAEWVGEAEKQFALGNAYYQGDGVPQNFAEAVKWYRKAAEQEHTNSQYMLGLMYDRGEGMPTVYVEAVAWYRKAAEKGHTKAQLELGKKYAEGKGVPQNFAEAYVWCNLAAASGLEAAIEERDSLASKLSKEEISEAQRRSMQLFESFSQGEPEN